VVDENVQALVGDMAGRRFPGVSMSLPGSDLMIEIAPSLSSAAAFVRVDLTNYPGAVSGRVWIPQWSYA
jgi:hypothetical protein